MATRKSRRSSRSSRRGGSAAKFAVGEHVELHGCGHAACAGTCANGCVWNPGSSNPNEYQCRRCMCEAPLRPVRGRITRVLRRPDGRRRYEVVERDGSARWHNEGMIRRGSHASNVHPFHGDRRFGNAGMVLHRPPGSALLPDNAQYTNRFEIRSSSSDAIYTVAQSKTGRWWACSCPGWIRYKKCKHLAALGLPGKHQAFEAALGPKR